MSIIKSLLLEFILFHFCLSHSWISCTNYQLTKEYTQNTKQQPILYNIQHCNGFPRNYQLQYQSDINRGFGYDTGYNHNSNTCKYNYDPNYYSKDHYIAKYSPGQTVCLTYPSKNHVADICTNLFIEDNGMKIVRSEFPLTEDFNKEYTHLNGIHQKGIIDYKGFQHCPGFCNNTDKTVCYVCFNLETSITPGRYSFKWVWEFNKNEFYSTCWDADIANDNNQNYNKTYNDKPCIINRKLSDNNLDYKYDKTKICNNQQNMQSYITTPSMTPNNIEKNKKKCIINPNNQNSNNQNPNNQNPNNQNPNNQNPNNQNPNNQNPNNQNSNNQNPNNQNPNNQNSNNQNPNNQNNKAKIWEQCGGNNLNRECIESSCIKYSPYYSQCLPNILEQNALCGQNDGKEINWFYDKCTNNLKCIPIPNSMDYRCI